MKDKIVVTCIRNPFKPIESQDTKYIDCLQPVSLQEIIRNYYPAPLDTAFDVAVSVNGRLLPENTIISDYEINPGDFVAFCAVPKGGGGGGGKDIARSVAMLALVVVTAFVLPPLIEGPLLLMGAQIGTMVAGSLLINALLPPSIPDIEGFDTGDYSNSPTYSWEPMSNLYQENIALPVLYGTHRVTPPCIGRYVSTDGDKQYLNLLYAIAGHYIDSIDDIEINDTPIDYYSDIEVEKRYGEINQTAIPFFQDTFSDQAINTPLTTSYTTKQTLGNSVSSIGIGISLPQGLFYVNNSGGLDQQSVAFQIQYRRVGYLTWQDYGEVTITEATNSAVRRYYLISGLTPDQYEVRIKLSSALPTGSRYRNLTYWEYMQEIVADDFTYPGIALLGLKVLATDQLSGSTPRVTCLVARNNVSVYTGSGYENKPAMSPAWVCYDILHNENCGDIPYSKIIYEKFSEWADRCSEKGYTCNIYFDSAMNLRKALDTVSQLGRGTVIQIGSKFSVVYDSEDLPVQRFMFTMGNIIKDSFQETWLSTDERANVIEVTYYDEELNYSKQTITLEQAGLNTDVELKPTQIDLLGCTSRDMAVKHAKYLMNCNRYLTNTVSFNADVDAIACLPGDVIEVAHDVPQWGYSGRIVSATSGSVTLDREVTLYPSETYVVTIQHYDTDDRETRYVSSVGQQTTTDTLSITQNWTRTPSKYALYSFGKVNQATKLFRVLNISRASDMQRKITALEYWPDVYDDSVELPYFTNISDLAPVIGLQATENLKFGADGSVKNIISLTWRGSAIKWYVYISKISEIGPWTLLGTTYNPFYEVENLIPGKTYYFAVNNKPNPYEFLPVSVEFTGKSYVPTQPTGLTATLSGQFIVLNWTANADIGTYGYNIYLNDSLLVSNYTGNRYTYRGNLTAGTYNFKITALNRNLEESDYSQTASISISAPSTPSPSYSISGEIVTIYWTSCQTSLPISHYTVNGTNIGLATRYQVRITWTGTQTFYVKAVDVAGNESGTGSVDVTITAVPTPTGLTATGGVYSIILTASVTIPEGGVLEVWSATVNNRANAVKIGDATSTTFTHTGLGLVDIRYYWVRVRDKYGTVGDWYPSSATNGVQGQTSTDPTDYLTILEGEITEDQLSQELSSRINIIDHDYVYETGVYEYTDPFTMVFGGLDKMVDSIYTTVVSHDTSIEDLITETQEHAAAITVLQSEIAGLTTEEWSNTESYIVGRYVVHDGKVYRCIQGYTPPPAYEPGETGSEEYWEDVQAIINLVTEIDQRVDELEGTIVTKVSQTDFNALSNTVSSHTSSIAQLSNEIALKVSQSDFDAFGLLFMPDFDEDSYYSINDWVKYGGSTYRCIQDIDFTPAPTPGVTEGWEEYWSEEEFADTFSTYMSQVDINTTNISLYSGAITGDITYLFDNDETRTFENGVYVEDASDVEDIDLRLTQAGIEIDGINATIELHADYIDGLDNRISTAEADIDGLNAQIALKASQTDFDELESRVSAAEVVIDGYTSTIGLHTSQISSLQSETSSLDNRLDTAETTISSHSSTLSNYGSRLTSAETTISTHTSSISNHETRISSAETAISAGQAGTWSSISEKLTTATYNSDQKDTNSYLRVAALENRFLVYDTQNVQNWNNSTTYYPGTIVKSGSTYYRCIKQSYNNQPPNSTYWVAISEGLVSQWTLKLNTNGRVAGMGMMLDSSTGSEFVILADKFKIMRPDETGNPVQIFTAGTINGVNSVGISGDLIIDGSILARNIGTNEIITQSANIKDGIITNAKIASLDAGKITSGYISADRIQAGTIAVDKLTTGEFKSKIFTISVESGSGDSVIRAGKTDFDNTESGFILGIDDSDSGKAKFFIGNNQKYINWDGKTFSVRGVIDIENIGVSWVKRNVPVKANYGDVCWSPDLSLFVAVGYAGTTSIVITSPTGVQWTQRTVSFSGSWKGVCWSPDLELFCAVGESGKVMTSPDGISWTERTGASGDWRKVCWSPELGLFCAVASAGIYRIMTSPNGIDWTQRGNTGVLYDICWSSDLELFVAVGVDTVKYSSDGINWSNASITYPGGYSSNLALTAVCWSEDLTKFIAVGYLSDYGSISYVSTNGTSWSNYNDMEMAYTPYAVCWVPEVSLVVAIGSQSCWTSLDGLNWVDHYFSSSEIYYGLAYAPTVPRLVAIGGVSWSNYHCKTS